MWVLDAVLRGSSKRSPFLHTSTALRAARYFHVNDYSTVIVKIDLKAWLENEAHSQDPIIDPIIDLSTQNAQQSFFGKSPDPYGGWYSDNFCQAMRMAAKAEEVLLKWRGAIPPKYCTIVSFYDEEEQGPLEAVINPSGEPSPKRGAQVRVCSANRLYRRVVDSLEPHWPQPSAFKCQGGAKEDRIFHTGGRGGPGRDTQRLHRPASPVMLSSRPRRLSPRGDCRTNQSWYSRATIRRRGNPSS